MSSSVFHLFQTYAPLLILLVAAVGGLLHFHQLPPSLRLLAGGVGWALLIELTARFFTFHKIPNLFLIPIDLVGELTLLGLAYQAALRSASFNRWLPVVLALFAGYALFSVLAAPATIRFRPDLQIAEDCLLLVFVGLYLRKLLSELQVKRLERDAMFWVSAGLFFYSLGNVQIALFSNYMMQRYSHQLNVNVWAVHTLLVVILYSCYTLALWMRPQK